jgi:hypothetical protein
MSLEVEHAVAAAVADYLTANRPSGLDSTVQIHTMDTVERREAPSLAVSCEDASRYGHRYMIELQLVLELQYQQDDTTAETAAGWLYAAYCAVEENVAAIRQELRPDGYWLRKLTPMEPGGNDGRGERGRILRARWVGYVQTNIV